MQRKPSFVLRCVCVCVCVCVVHPFFGLKEKNFGPDL